MTRFDYQSIVSLLSAERDRYTLEAADLESQLQHVRSQITNIKFLISGYSLEEQVNLRQRDRFEEQNSSFFNEDELKNFEPTSEVQEELDSNQNRQAIAKSHPNQIHSGKFDTSKAIKIDISDIPKLTFKRKPRSLSLLPQFQDYSIQNAILILLRCRPELHFQVDTIVYDLYGKKLTYIQLKTAKTNVYKALSAGVKLGLWVINQGVIILENKMHNSF
ncbi:MAG: hypothetical protein PUP91_38190 [Rhizonema sp. PD37]|nr:hypothetical protein [Rhizonema sp. PD37]